MSTTIRMTPRAILFCSLFVTAIFSGCWSSSPSENEQTDLRLESEKNASFIKARIDYELDDEIVHSEEFELSYAKFTEHVFLQKHHDTYHNGWGGGEDTEYNYVSRPALEIGWKREDRIRYNWMTIEGKQDVMKGWKYTGNLNSLLDFASFEDDSCAWLNVKNFPPASYSKIQTVVFVWDLDPGDVSEHQKLNSLAWTLSTFPIEQIRDGKKAVRLAKAACEKAEWKQHNCIDTLASAHAEMGDFSKAVEYQEKAIEVLSKDDQSIRAASLSEYQERLQLFKDKKPYRQW